MAICDKYKLYGELARELYALGYNFAKIAKLLTEAFPSPGGEAAPPGPVTVATWYKKDAANWDAAKQVRTSYAATVRKIYENALENSAANKARAAEDGAELCSKWWRHLREIEDRELEKPVSLLKKLNRDIDRPALFIEHLQFIFSTLPQGSAAYKALAAEMDNIIDKYKDHVAAQTNHRAQV